MSEAMGQVEIRSAATADVRDIRRLVDAYAGDGPRMLRKNMVTLYEDVQEFLVATQGPKVIGCGALHVLWEDLAEVRTLAVDPQVQRSGVGSLLLQALLGRARELGLKRVFCLTFATEFFGRHGFVEIDGTPVEPQVYQQLLESYDEGVAEFLELEWVKPNTLGNNRMLLVL